MRQLHGPGEVGDRGHPGPRPQPPQEQRLRLVEVPHPGQIPLIEQRLRDRRLRTGLDPPRRLGRVPVGPQQIRPEMPDQALLLRRRHQLEVVQVVADRHRPGAPQHHPDQMRGPPGPPLTRRVGPPRPVHPQVRVQGEARLPVPRQPQQQMLAPPARRLGHRPTAQIRRSQPRHPEVGSGQHLPGQRPLDDASGVPHGVPLRHTHHPDALGKEASAFEEASSFTTPSTTADAEAGPDPPPGSRTTSPWP